MHINLYMFRFALYKTKISLYNVHTKYIFLKFKTGKEGIVL